MGREDGNCDYCGTLLCMGNCIKPSKFKQMAEENDVFRIMRDGSGYVGIVYHPDTGQQIEKFHAGSEQAVRLQLIKYIYSTVPMGYNKD